MASVEILGLVRNAFRMSKPRQYFKAWRKHAELSQETAAERIGITRAQLSKLETGKRQYHQAFLEAAAHVYKCTVADLLVRHPEDIHKSTA